MSVMHQPVDVDLPAVPEAERPFLADPALGDGRFHNPWGVRNDRGFSDILRWKLTSSNPFAQEKRRRPSLPVADRPAELWQGLSEEARVQWLGHASVLAEVDGVRFLVDPLFGAAGVVPRLASAPLTVSELLRVDAVLLSHGHRDHLDARSLDALARRFEEALFLVPRGLGSALPRSCRRVRELSWWQQVDLRGVRFTFVPSQHWHMRTPFDRERALWGGWHAAGASRSLYHSGDTGYFGGFRTIRRVLGAPDVAVLPLGAYEPRWFMEAQHMSPEGSVQAFLDLGARHFLGMHWGTFDLTDEPVDHGAFTLLPELAGARGLAPERVHVLAHGGALGFARPEAVEVREPAIR